MRILFSPQRSEATLKVMKSGDTLTINRRVFDFSVIPEGATLPATAVDSPFVTGEVERVGGELRITLMLPHGPNPPPAIAFPADLVDSPDGELAIPQMPAAEEA